MPFVESDGCRIYYRLEGAASRPLLVLVHSLGTDHGMWDPQMPALLNRFQVLRLDLRGHGASDAPAGDYTISPTRAAMFWSLWTPPDGTALPTAGCRSAE